MKFGICSFQHGALSGLLCLLSTLFSMNSHAQTAINPITIDEAITNALQKDPNYLAYIASLNASKELERSNLGSLLPTISASYNNYPSADTKSRNVVNQSTSDWTSAQYRLNQSSILLKQPIIRMRNWANYLQSVSAAEQAAARLEFVKYQTILRVVDLYLQLVYFESELKSREALVRAITEKLAQTKAMQARKLASNLDVLRVQSDLDRAIFDVSISKKNLEMIKEQFAQVTGENNHPKELDLDLWNRIIAITDLNQFKDSNITGNPEVITLRKAIEIAEWEVKKIKTDHLPTVDFVASYAEESNAVASVLGRETKTTISGVQIIIPLYQGGSTAAQIRQAQANLQKTRAELMVVENRIKSDLIGAVGMMSAAADALRAAISRVRRASAEQDSAVSGTRVGLASRTDVLDSEASVLVAKVEQVNAIKLWLNSHLSILALKGELLRVERGISLAVTAK